ncbi:MAG: hypothetical protein JJ899_14400 [Alphaproteobacteria bacterium]|nr:hypothetical protein [Alphaproteobacteria bacterium]
MPNSTTQKRSERLQLLLAPAELEAIDDWRYDHRIPTRAAAIRELLRRGLTADDLEAPADNADTSDYSVVDEQLSYSRPA